MKIIKTLFFTLLAFQFFGQISVFETDFQGGIPSEMTIIDNDLNVPNTAVSEYTDAWICISDPENPSDSVAASTSWFTPIDTADRWLITPQLILGSYGNSIYWDSKSQDASYPDDYYILASTTDMNPSSFVDTLGYIQQENFEWTNRSVDLSAEGYDSQSIYIAFVLRTYDGFKLYIDDIQVFKDDDASNQETSNIGTKIDNNYKHCKSKFFLKDYVDSESKKIKNLTANQINHWLAFITVNSILGTNNKEVSKSFNDNLVQGRFEIISRDPLKILDGAHNIDGFIKTLKDYEKEYSSVDTYLYLGFKNGKNIESIISYINLKKQYKLNFIEEDTFFDQQNPNNLIDYLENENIDYKIVNLEAFSSNKNPSILLGSLYLIGEYKKRITT